MSRKTHIKENLDRRDSNRAIITETAPYEVPIIFSNDGFYRNIKEYGEASDALKELIDAVVFKSRAYTIPYRYKITKNSRSTRKLSLLHPAAQFSVSQFYSKYENLICYYCSQSSFSIRYPEKIGSSFFISSEWAEKNAFKKDGVDTVMFDKFVRNPASYFAYRQYDRLYKFFRSNDFMRLEKKFSIMSFFDISNCFGSIYTHTISWALKNMRHAKKNISAISFGNDFDKLMQQMNFNETNGICIGPETSRIFSEVILQSVDREIVRKAKAHGYADKVHFECRRYVDDYILFTQDDVVAVALKEIVSNELGKYNLHLNHEKQDRFERPFQTNKSQIIEDINLRLASLLNTAIEKDSHTKRLIPKYLYKSDAFVRSFVSSVKSCCFERGVGYDMVANYVISILCDVIEDLMNGYSRAESDDETYIVSFLVFLELIYFLYTVQPTVGSSFKVTKATILSHKFFLDNYPDRVPFLSERLTSWMTHIVQSIQPEQIRGGQDKIPIEIMNIVLALSQLDGDQLVDSEYLEKKLFNIEGADYFSLISCLFYIRDNSKYSSMHSKIEKRLLSIFTNAEIAVEAHDVHLFWDIMSCPYVSLDFRLKIIKMIWKKLALPTRTRVQHLELIQEIQKRPWFVNWNSVDLLNMVRKKELSAVY